jgi:hypothetical protein
MLDKSLCHYTHHLSTHYLRRRASSPSSYSSLALGMSAEPRDDIGTRVDPGQRDPRRRIFVRPAFKGQVSGTGFNGSNAASG